METQADNPSFQAWFLKHFFFHLCQQRSEVKKARLWQQKDVSLIKVLEFVGPFIA